MVVKKVFLKTQNGALASIEFTGFSFSYPHIILERPVSDKKTIKIGNETHFKAVIDAMRTKDRIFIPLLYPKRYADEISFKNLTSAGVSSKSWAVIFKQTVKNAGGKDKFAATYLGSKIQNIEEVLRFGDQPIISDGDLLNLLTLTAHVPVVAAHLSCTQEQYFKFLISLSTCHMV